MSDTRAIREKMEEAGINLSEYRDSVVGCKVYTFEDDQYSGKEISFEIDRDTGLLKRDCTDDSPEQAGGWICEDVFYNNEWWSVSNIADRFTFVIFDSKVYLCEIDQLFSDRWITITEAVKEGAKPGNKMFRKVIGYDEYMRLRAVDTSLLRKELMAILENKDYEIVDICCVED
jgi:hypothetical protein